MFAFCTWAEMAAASPLRINQPPDGSPTTQALRAAYRGYEPDWRGAAGGAARNRFESLAGRSGEDPPLGSRHKPEVKRAMKLK